MLKIIPLILAVALVTIIFSSNSNAMNYKEFAIDRMRKTNNDWCEETGTEKATDKQLENRFDALVYWSKHFNDMYPSIDYRRVVKDMLEIMLHETRVVNYGSFIDKNGNRYGKLDNGESFGIWSMQWETVHWIADKNDWGLDNRNDEIKLMNDPREQTKYAVWYMYYMYQRMDSKAARGLSLRNIRLSVLVGYNNPSINPNEERSKKYFFVIFGRIKYQEKLISERVTENYNWESE